MRYIALYLSEAQQKDCFCLRLIVFPVHKMCFFPPFIKGRRLFISLKSTWKMYEIPGGMIVRRIAVVEVVLLSCSLSAVYRCRILMDVH